MESLVCPSVSSFCIGISWVGLFYGLCSPSQAFINIHGFALESLDASSPLAKMLPGQALQVQVKRRSQRCLPLSVLRFLNTSCFGLPPECLSFCPHGGVKGISPVTQSGLKLSMQKQGCIARHCSTGTSTVLRTLGTRLQYQFESAEEARNIHGHESIWHPPTT